MLFTAARSELTSSAVMLNVVVFPSLLNTILDRVCSRASSVANSFSTCSCGASVVMVQESFIHISLMLQNPVAVRIPARHAARELQRAYRAWMVTVLVRDLKTILLPQ